jgi:hypothetical protein
LKRGSNMIAIMLWIHNGSKDLKKSKKGLITFLTPSHIFLCNIKIYASKGSKSSYGLAISNNSTSMFIVKVITIVKVFDDNQWPLDWFSTHVETIGFKVNVTTSTTTHTWALKFYVIKHRFIPTIIENNDILKLQSLFKHNGLASESCFHMNF